jgi:hypothetical protein
MSCGCPSCAKCCTVTPLFWLYMSGLAGTFASLFLFFWQYPGTLTQFRGPREEGYIFVDDGNGALAIYRDNVLIASGINDSNNGLEADEINDLRQAHCRGTSLLWTTLIGGLLSTLFLLWWIVQNPDRFVCCSLRQPHEELQRQYEPFNTVAPPPLPVMKAAPTVPTPPVSPAPKLA